jgi:hypothetical protein
VLGGGGLRAYALVLRHGPAARPFAAAVVARLPIPMAPLGTVLLVQEIRGSYTLAGVVAAAFALGTAAGSPVWGRAMDLLGQARALVPSTLASAGLLAGLALGAVGGAADVVLVALSLGAGLTFPPFSAAMRSAWRVVLPPGPQLRAAFALDAVAVETIFVVGPLLLSVLLVLTPPVVPLLVTAALLAGGGLAYSSTGPARAGIPAPVVTGPLVTGPLVTGPATPGPAVADPIAPVAAPTASRPARTARRPVDVAAAAVGLPPVLAVCAAMSVGFGAIDTSLAATAREVLQDEGRLGFLYAAIAGGSATGGLVYGAAASHEDEHRRLPLTLGVFALGLAPLPFLLGDRPALALVLPLLFVAGVAIAPSLIIMQAVVDRFAPVGRVNEAQAWLSTAITTGSALGIAMAGVVIDGRGVPAAFAAAAVAVTGACLVAAAAQRTWSRPPQDDALPQRPHVRPARSVYEA